MFFLSANNEGCAAFLGICLFISEWNYHRGEDNGPNEKERESDRSILALPEPVHGCGMTDDWRPLEYDG